MLGFMKKKKEETISYGVIGLGKFGYTLAIQLAEYGYDFLVVDRREFSAGSQNRDRKRYCG